LSQYELAYKPGLLQKSRNKPLHLSLILKDLLGRKLRMENYEAIILNNLKCP